MSCSSIHIEDQKSTGQTLSPTVQEKTAPAFETLAVRKATSHPGTILLSTRVPNTTLDLTWTPLPTLDKEASSIKISEKPEHNMLLIP